MIWLYVHVLSNSRLSEIQAQHVSVLIYWSHLLGCFLQCKEYDNSKVVKGCVCEIHICKGGNTRCGHVNLLCTLSCFSSVHIGLSMCDRCAFIAVIFGYFKFISFLAVTSTYRANEKWFTAFYMNGSVSSSHNRSVSGMHNMQWPELGCGVMSKVG